MGLVYFPAFTPKTSIMLVNIPLNCVSGDILTGCVCLILAQNRDFLLEAVVSSKLFIFHLGEDCLDVFFPDIQAQKNLRILWSLQLLQLS